MKCLVLHQPQAHLVAIGLKPLETRTWRTLYRGPLAIAAGKTWDDEYAAWIASCGIQLPPRRDLSF
jgi:hypothetical protein